MNERKDFTVVGGSTADKAEILWGLAERVPISHTHPKMTTRFWEDESLGWIQPKIV